MDLSSKTKYADSELKVIFNYNAGLHYLCCMRVCPYLQPHIILCSPFGCPFACYAATKRMYSQQFLVEDDGFYYSHDDLCYDYNENKKINFGHIKNAGIKGEKFCCFNVQNVEIDTDYPDQEGAPTTFRLISVINAPEVRDYVLAKRDAYLPLDTNALMTDIDDENVKLTDTRS